MYKCQNCKETNCKYLELYSIATPEQRILADQIYKHLIKVEGINEMTEVQQKAETRRIRKEIREEDSHANSNLH